MFKDIISSTVLTSETADRCFQDRITGDHFRGDHSVLATARALFGSRLKEGEQIKISCKDVWGVDQGFYNNVKDSAKNLERGELVIWSVGVLGDDAGKWVNRAKTALNETGLYELEALKKWFEQSASTHALVYSDQPYDPKIPKSPVNNAKTILILENVSIRYWHLIAALLPRLLGDWFQEKPRTDKETELCLAFNGDSADKVQELFNEIAKQYDFRSAEIRAMLNGFESQYARQMVKLLQEKADNAENRIRDLMRQIGMEQKAKEQTLAELWGHQEKIKQASGSNTMEYFLANQNLYLKSANADMYYENVKRFEEISEKNQKIISMFMQREQLHDMTSWVDYILSCTKEFPEDAPFGWYDIPCALPAGYETCCSDCVGNLEGQKHAWPVQ